MNVTHRGERFRVLDEPGVAACHADEATVREEYWRIEPGQQVIDIGAAIGSWTLPALAHGASVLAVDPSPHALEVLARSAALNGWSCETVRAALFDGTPYPRGLEEAIFASPWSELAPPADAQWTTLDALVPAGPADWVKVDVEGAEAGVLRGGRELLARCRPRLVIEEHSRVYPYVAAAGYAGQLRALLDGLGYDIAVVPYDPDGRTPRDYWICEPRP